MGCRCTWVSSYGTDFTVDVHVSFTTEDMAMGQVSSHDEMRAFGSAEAPGTRVFSQDGTGDIFHPSSSDARGHDLLTGAYHDLDLVPKGRDEDALAFPMAWGRHHDRYGADDGVDPTALSVAPQGSDGACGAGEDRS
jgi:predicted dithiol-disulfide oxidoreductase (DUF899 family)